jgi:hypothetical protein
MSALYEELPFSEFLHQPAATAARLDTVRAIRLRRRGADDLSLSRADQADRDATVIDFTARLLEGLAREGETTAIQRVLPHALPWSTFLPELDREEMLDEIIEVAQGASSIRNLAPMATLLEQWRRTAEAHADPELYQRLTAGPAGDFGPVPEPEESA